jgi:t-SNARE complex subunit (syntaxin)
MSNIMDKIIIDAPSKKLEDAMRNKVERYIKEQKEFLDEVDKETEKEIKSVMDDYRDVGMSPSDFFSNEEK